MTSIRRLASCIALALASLCSASARADDDELDGLLRNTASTRQAIDAYVHRQRVRAVPLASYRGRCPRVGLIYLDQKRRGGERIATFDVCPMEVIDTGEVSPALPDDKVTRDTGQFAMQAAARYGRRATEYQGYLFDANRLTAPDTNGCAQVETTVSFEGLLVANSTGRVCP